MRTAFAYLRVSTRKQDEDHQRKSIVEYAKLHDIQVLEWFVDIAVSGRKFAPKERPAFGEMFQILEDRVQEGNPVQNVIVFEVSRLGRTFWETIDVLRMLEESFPIISVSPQEAFFTDVADKSIRQLFISLLTWIAQREWENTHERIMSGLKSSKDEKRHSGNIPLGFSQHLCREHGARDRSEYCELHGKLSLDARGKEVKMLLDENPKIAPKKVQEALNVDDYNYAYKILRSVKKFGQGASG